MDGVDLAINGTNNLAGLPASTNSDFLDHFFL